MLSAWWEMVLRDTYVYLILSAYECFYAGVRALSTPLFVVPAACGILSQIIFESRGSWALQCWPFEVFFSPPSSSCWGLRRYESLHQREIVCCWIFLRGSLAT